MRRREERGGERRGEKGRKSRRPTPYSKPPPSARHCHVTVTSLSFWALRARVRPFRPEPVYRLHLLVRDQLEWLFCFLSRYEKQLEQEEQAYQQQRRRLYAEVQEEKERVALQAQKQRQELDEARAALEVSES